MHLIKEHGGDTFQEGVFAQECEQHAFGQEQQPGLFAALVLKADAVADVLTELGLVLLADAPRGGPCGEPARLDHQGHALPREGIGDGDRDTGRLARTGGCLEHQGGA